MVSLLLTLNIFTPFSNVSVVDFEQVNVLLASSYFIINPFNPSHPNPGRREKFKLNFYSHTSLWCLKRFYEGLFRIASSYLNLIYLLFFF